MLSFLSTYWYAVLLALGSGLYLCWPMFGNRAGGRPLIEPQDAVQLMNRKQGVLLDVREQAMIVREGVRITQARAIPASELEGRIGELKKFQNKPVIVQSLSGRPGLAACDVLQKNGFTDVQILSGGVVQWQKAGLPIQRVSP